MQPKASPRPESKMGNELNARRAQMLRVGDRAPGFCLKATPDQYVGLEDFAGQPVVLLFYPADWSPVCSSELDLFNEALPEIQDHNAVLLGISVDSVWSHVTLARDKKIDFPLLADFEPKGEVSRAYGVYQDHEGVCSRALFLIDGHGIIRWAHLSPSGVNPGVDGVLDALEDLEHGAHGSESPRKTA